jgi:hypothetical protein
MQWEVYAKEYENTIVNSDDFWQPNPNRPPNLARVVAPVAPVALKNPKKKRRLVPVVVRDWNRDVWRQPLGFYHVENCSCLDPTEAKYWFDVTWMSSEVFPGYCCIVPTADFSRPLHPIRIVQISQLRGPAPVLLAQLPVYASETWTMHFFRYLAGWIKEGKCKFYVASLPRIPTSCVSTVTDDHYKILRIEGAIGFFCRGLICNRKNEPLTDKDIHKNMRERGCIQPMQTYVPLPGDPQGAVRHRSNPKEFEFVNYYDVRFDKMNKKTFHEFQSIFGIQDTDVYTHHHVYYQ